MHLLLNVQRPLGAAERLRCSRGTTASPTFCLTTGRRIRIFNEDSFAINGARVHLALHFHQTDPRLSITIAIAVPPATAPR